MASPAPAAGLAHFTPVKVSPTSSGVPSKSRLRWHPIVERGGRPTLVTRRKQPIPFFVEIPPPKLFLPHSIHAPRPTDPSSTLPTPPPTVTDDETKDLGTASSFGKESSHSGLRLVFDDNSIRTLPYRTWTQDQYIQLDGKLVGHLFSDIPLPSPSLTAPPLIPLSPPLAGGWERTMRSTCGEREEGSIRRRDIKRLPVVP